MIVRVKVCQTSVSWAGRPGLLSLSFFLFLGRNTVWKVNSENARKQHQPGVKVYSEVEQKKAREKPSYEEEIMENNLHSTTIRWRNGKRQMQSSGLTQRIIWRLYSSLHWC